MPILDEVCSPLPAPAPRTIFSRRGFEGPLRLALLAVLLVWVGPSLLYALDPSPPVSAKPAVGATTGGGAANTGTQPEMPKTLDAGLGPWNLTVLAFLGFCVLVFLGGFAWALRRGDVPSVETHWGGFGGSLGGWQISPALACLAAALALSFLFTVLAMYWMRPAGMPSAVNETRSGAAASSTGSAKAGETSSPASGTEQAHAP